MNDARQRLEKAMDSSPEKFKKLSADVYNGGDYIFILTPGSVYKASDSRHKSWTLDDEKLARYLGGVRPDKKHYIEQERGVFEWKGSPGHAIIVKGNCVHTLLDEWERISHEKFLETVLETV
jgi:hypothetical protein